MIREPSFISVNNDRTIAYYKSEGRKSTVIFCGRLYVRYEWNKSNLSGKSM